MKKPDATPATVDLEAPPMPIPPHGGSFVLNEESNTLVHVSLPVPEPEAVEATVENPVKLDVKEFL